MRPAGSPGPARSIQQALQRRTAALARLRLLHQRAGDGVDPGVEVDLLVLQRDAAHDRAAAAGDPAGVVLELELLVAELQRDAS